MAHIEALIGRIADPRLRTEIAAALRSAKGRTVEIGKEYRLEYAGKMPREEVLAQTPAAPWQLVRSFCGERPHGKGAGRWRNLLTPGADLRCPAKSSTRSGSARSSFFAAPMFVVSENRRFCVV